MGVLASLERKIRSLTEGLFGRLFGGQLQAAEIRRRLLTELAASERVMRGRSVVANRYEARLSTKDASGLRKSIADLGLECEQALEQQARAKRWVTLGPFEVRFLVGERFARGQVMAEVECREGMPETRVDVLSGPDRGAVFRGVFPETTIGRAPDCSVRLTDPDASRDHAIIRSEGYTMRVIDHSSANGTYLGGRRVSEEEITDGARLEVGRSILLVSLGRPVWSLPSGARASGENGPHV
jgi:hypothetical protein